MNMKAAKWIMTVISVLITSIVISVVVMSAVLGRQARRTLKEERVSAKSSYTEMTAVIDEGFADIYIEAADDMEVRLQASESDSCQVEYYNSDDVIHSVYVEDDTLRITCVDNRTFGSDLGFGDDPYITVSLPERRYGAVKLVSDSGRLQSNASMTCDEFEVVQNKGDVYVTNLSANYVSVTAVSGDVTMATIDSANITANGVSGDFSIMNLTAQNMQFSVKSGRLEGYNIDSDSMGGFTTESGDIVMQGCTGDSLEFTTDKGDVDVSLLDETVFDVYTVNGDVAFPEQNTDKGGKCTIHTESGDIKAAYVN